MKSITSKLKSLIIMVAVLALTLTVTATSSIGGGLTAGLRTGSSQALSKLGSEGSEVTAIQEALQERGLFSGEVTGYYGTKTQTAVRRFQQQKGLTVDGIAGPETLAALGISIGSVPEATESNINLLAQIISAEARGEPYEGQVAVGAVVLNRVEHPSFPDTISGVIYQEGAFSAVDDGQFWEPVEDSCYDAARDALNGWDPSGGAIYYYNPDKTSNAFITSRPVITKIGNHLFCS
ncbi:MAG: spore cortex-lytic enzyme [Oscillospiraceae bacterium]|nr:spore cortex-lytic enzyme [Oscillospiraceae bacterium]